MNDTSNPVTLQEALPALKQSLIELQQAIFENTDKQVPENYKKEFKEALITRCNFTKDIIGFIEDLQFKYKGNAELNELHIRYSDCHRQLLRIYNRI